MDHTGWIWQRRPSHNTIVASHNPQQLVMIPEEERQESSAAGNLNEKPVLVDDEDPQYCNGANSSNHVRISEAAANAGQQKSVEIQARREVDEALKREMVMNEMLRFEASKAVRDLEERVTQLRGENSHLRALQDQQQQKNRSLIEAEFTSLIARLDSVEKENAFLKYECHVLEKEVEIRNEEMEYTRRSADAAKRESLEAAKEMAKLEAECQRVHLALQRRLPGPTAAAAGSRRTRRTNGGEEYLTRNLHLLVEQLQNVKAENRSLKEIVIKKDAEIQQLLELIERSRSLTSDSWHYSERKFKSLPGNKAIEVPEMRLMDDFAEMERLAIVSTEVGLNPQVSDSAEPFDWLQVVLQAMVKQKGISKRSLDDLLENVKIALGCGAYTCNEKTDRIHSLEQDPDDDVCGYITWKGSNLPPTKDSSSGAPSIIKHDTLTMQLQDSVTTIGGLKKEVKKLQEEKETMEDRIDDQRSINEDLDTQLTVLKSKLNEVFQKCSSLEIELEYKNNCCEELEATCLELQLQLESAAREEVPKQGSNHERGLTQNLKPQGWEITAASIKLAECQEAILNLGRQLKVLASPREAVLFDRLFSNSHRALTSNKKMNKHFSLRDQMQADDAVKAERLRSQETKAVPGPESRSSSELQAQGTLASIGEPRLGSRSEGGNNSAVALAVVPNKKPGIGLLRLLFRKKRGSRKKVGC